MGVAEGLHSLLAALSRYAGAERLYELELAGTGSDLVVERWQGIDALSSGYEWHVDALSVDAHLPLDELLGQRATLWTRSADGSRIARTGLVGEAECVGSDGSLARYRLILVPWVWLLSQGRHSRIFQDKTIPQIVEAVFAGYAPYAAWHWSEEVGPFLAQVRSRSFLCQYRESDEVFVQRLLAEEGLGTRLEEAEDTPGGHRLVLFADSGQGPQEASSEAHGGVRYHRSDATETHDTIQALGVVRKLGPTGLALLSHDYKTTQATTASLPIGDQHDSATALEWYDPVGSYAFANRAEAERYAGLMADALQGQHVFWLGQSTVRSFCAGPWLTVTQLPAQGDVPPAELLLVSLQHAGVNNLPKAVAEGIEERLGIAPALTIPLIPDVPQTVWRSVLKRAEAVGYANAFSAVPRDQPWRPVLADDTGARLNPRPTAPGYMTALVVGADGNASANGAGELHSDALGRIKVKFPFQHEVQGAEAAADTCWLRVAQRYAGPGVGIQFLPRIGQEVLIAFLDGDIDRPLVVSALYNGQGEAGIAASPGGKAGAEVDTAALYAQATDHGASAQANLRGGHAPPWHGLSAAAEGHRNAAALLGIKSKEFGGTGYNLLAFDDSDGQLGARIATTQAASALHLGHLIHQADNYRGSFRGEGFELRSDQWGVVRAQAGLWLSGYALSGETPAGDAVAATALLQQAEQLGKVFSQAATTHQTVKLAASEGVAKARQSKLIDDQAPLAALLTSARTTVDGQDYAQAQASAKERKPEAGPGRVPHSGDALLGLTAPAGIGVVAGQSLQWAVGETLTLASGQASNLAIAKDLRLHTGQAIGLLASAVEGAAAAKPSPSRGGLGGDGSASGPAALSLVTAEGELDLQAQHDLAKLQSRDGLKVVSANAEVELAAGKTIHLATAGGASVTIEGGNIVFQCPGTITVHAGKHSFVGPTQLSREMNSWPEGKFDQRIRLVKRSGEPVKNYRYEIHRSDGAVISGISDAEGWTPLQKGAGLDDLVIKLLGPAEEKGES